MARTCRRGEQEDGEEIWVVDKRELDEAWNFVGRKAEKRWLPAAMCRRTMCQRTRQIVAFVIGDRSAKTCARLWSKIPSGYRRCQSFSDFWKAYGQVFGP